MTQLLSWFLRTQFSTSPATWAGVPCFFLSDSFILMGEERTRTSGFAGLVSCPRGRQTPVLLRGVMVMGCVELGPLSLAIQVFSGEMAHAGSQLSIVPCAMFCSMSCTLRNVTTILGQCARTPVEGGRAGTCAHRVPPAPVLRFTFSLTGDVITGLCFGPLVRQRRLEHRSLIL